MFIILTHFTSENLFLIITQQISLQIQQSVSGSVNQVSVYVNTEPFFTCHQHLISDSGIGMIVYDCGPLVCVMAAESLLMCICFRQ